MTGDHGFQTVMDEGILELLYRFAPEMLLVSYGFDTHWRDPLGNLLLSASGYASLISSLTNWADENCDGRIMLVLEGGYDLQAAAACGVGVTAALIGQDWVDPLGPSPVTEGRSWLTMFDQAKVIWDL
jgi:acetoin utilization deacetylase AcuC-like enzyme